MHRFLNTIVTASLILCITGYAAEVRLDPAVADSLASLIDDPIQRADFFTLAWMNDRAIAELETADLDDPEVLWRLARSRIDKAENIEGKNALKIYEQALQEAEKAVKLDPKNPSVLQTLSIVYGRIALFKGVFKSIDLVNKVHNTALLAVAESDSMPVALYVLGRTHKKLIEKSGLVRSLLGLGWASPDSVTYYFEYALAVSGGNMIQCRVEYGDFLLNTVKNKQAAAEMLRTALELPLRDEQDAKAKDWANELLRKIK